MDGTNNQRKRQAAIDVLDRLIEQAGRLTPEFYGKVLLEIPVQSGSLQEPAGQIVAHVRPGKT